MSITAYKARRMKKEELLRVACEYGCEVDPDAKRPHILAAVLSKIESGQRPIALPGSPAGDKELFEQLTQPAGDPAAPGQDTEEQQGGHGGARPGSGRKPGVTLEQIRIDKLPTEPNRTVVYVIKWLFRLWAAGAGCDEIRLDDEELREFAIDTTQFLEYHGIRIPQGMAVDGKFILNGCELIGGRLMLHKAHKTRQKLKNEQVAEKNDVQDRPGEAIPSGPILQVG